MSMLAPTHGRKYWYLGLDLGTYSVGFVAIEVDEDGMPVAILNAHSYIHDGGVDPSGHKSKSTRRAVSGIARRTRRRYNSLQATYRALDSFLLSNGLPVTEYVPGTDTDPWKARALLAGEKLPEEIRDIALSICVRHMVRHRGHRNPYLTTRSLHNPGSEPSPDFLLVKEKIEAEVGESFPDDATLPEMIDRLNSVNHNRRIRGERKRGKGKDEVVVEAGVASGRRLRQFDYARELRKIEEVQGLDHDLVTGLIDRVFHQKSPKGSAEKNVGFDSLPGQTGKRRAPRYTAAFQRYRIAAQLGNVRVRVPGSRETKPLTREQITAAFDLLSTWTSKETPTWDQLAEKLGLEPGQLRAPVSSLDGESDDITRAPFIDRTNQVLSTSKCKPLAAYWKGADTVRRERLLMEMSNGASSAKTASLEQERIAAEVDELLGGMTEDEMVNLEKVSLEDGRSAYSEDSLNRLTARILSEGVDLFTARQAEFGVPNDWTPPAPALTERTLNAAVDRSLAHVHAALTRLESRYGPPQRIAVEYARDGMMTAKVAAQHERRNNARRTAREKFWESRGVEGRPAPAKARRWEVVETQNSQCFYCGNKIDAGSCDLDHIVPRSGIGSRNTRDNLVATCARCNLSKGNLPYATWVKTCGIPGTDMKSVTARMKHWTEFGSKGKSTNKKLIAEITARLKRTSLDEPIDERSIESTAWMAREVRRRLIHRYESAGAEVKIDAYSGRITSAARTTWVAGNSPDTAVSVDRSVPMYGGTGKQRLDRRHHALDAAVVAMMTHYPAEVLAQREALRWDNKLGISPAKSGDPSLPGGDVTPPWQEFTGVDQAHKVAFEKWKKRTEALIELMSQALEQDRVPVTRSLRLGPSRGRLHEETVMPLLRLPLGGSWTAKQVMCLADHRVWVALTRLPDFTWKTGLDADPDRKIVVGGKTFTGTDPIEVMGSVDKKGKVTYTASGVPVRGGWAFRGEAWHHMRLYTYSRKNGNKALIRERAGSADLARYRKFSTTDDLFSIPLPKHTVSSRADIGVEASSHIYGAHMEGQTDYLGWLVLGDELYIPEEVMREQTKKQAVELQEFVGRPVTRWLITGTGGVEVSLRPVELASEGVDHRFGEPEEVKAIKSLIEREWTVSLSTLLSWPGVVVIRRNVLGEVRLGSGNGVPVSWRLAEGMVGEKK